MATCYVGIVAQACFGTVFVASPKRRLRFHEAAFAAPWGCWLAAAACSRAYASLEDTTFFHSPFSEYALPSVEEDVQPEARPAIVEPPEDDAASIVTPDDAANSSILKMSGAPASKRRRVFDDRLNVVPLGPLPGERPLGPSAHEVWFGCPKD